MTTTTHEQGSLEWSDLAPTYCEGVADLYRWSANFDDFAPWRVFLGLISYELHGEPLALPNMSTALLGYVELGKIAEALTEYANRPQDVERWIGDLLGVEEESGL